jgi:transcriptional regulator with XRE-family HTH domain
MDSLPVTILRQRINGRTQSAVAKELGIMPSYLSDVLKGRREPGPQVLDALGLERVISYRQKGRK